jgi:hypothetical protein
MMTLTEIFFIIIVHWIADFIFQAEEWATNKSKSNLALLKHVSTYSTIWVFASCILLGIGSKTGTTQWYVYNSLLFSLITFICHFITDYFTSRIVSRKFANKHFGSPIPNFGAFTIIGIDQVLHYVQLFLTYKMILNFI